MPTHSGVTTRPAALSMQGPQGLAHRTWRRMRDKHLPIWRQYET